MNDEQSLDGTTPDRDPRPASTPFHRPEAPDLDLDAAGIPLTVAQILEMAEFPEQRAQICLKANLQARHDELVDELGALVYADGTLREDVEASLGEKPAKARAIALQQEDEAVVAEMRRSMWRPLFRGISSDDLAVFNKEHWPKKQGDPLTDYHNRLIARCMVEPSITLDEVQALRKKLSHKAFQALVETASKVNVGLGVDVPKSPSFSLDLEAS